MLNLFYSSSGQSHPKKSYKRTYDTKAKLKRNIGEQPLGWSRDKQPLRYNSLPSLCDLNHTSPKSYSVFVSFLKISCNLWKSIGTLARYQIRTSCPSKLASLFSYSTKSLWMNVRSCTCWVVRTSSPLPSADLVFIEGTKGINFCRNCRLFFPIPFHIRKLLKPFPKYEPFLEHCMPKTVVSLSSSVH